MDTNIDNWKVLYPIYIDKEVSRESGRIVGKEDSIDKPTALEIELALRSLGFPCKYENKRHPASPFSPGRVRVVFKKTDGSPVYPGITSKISLCKKVVEIIPTLSHRAEAAKAIELKKQKEHEETLRLQGKSVKGNKGKKGKR